MFNKWITALLLLTALPLAADPPQVKYSHTFTATGSSITRSFIASASTHHRLAWYPTGTVLTCSVKLEKSADGSAWTDLIAAADCTSAGVSATTAGVHNYTRITLVTLTGGGSLTAVGEGYNADPSGSSASATVAAADDTANPTISQTAAFPFVYDGSTWDRLRGDSTNGAWVNIKASVALGRTWTIDGTTDSINLLRVGGNTLGANRGITSNGVLRVVVALVTSATVTAVADSASSVQLVASNSARSHIAIFNSSSATLYVKFGTTATTTDFTVRIAGGGFYEMPAVTVYSGRIDGIWASDPGDGSAHITEY
jgi:hypothetical protein